MSTQHISNLPFKTAKEVLEESRDNATFPASSVMKIKNSLPKEGFVACTSSDLHILVVEGEAIIQIKDNADDKVEILSLTPQTVIHIPIQKSFRIEGDVVIVLLNNNKEEFRLMRV